MVKISASKLATFQKCSWLFFCKYHLRLPDTPNVGSQQGTECHTILECLLKPSHKKLYDAVMRTPATITNCPVIERHVRSYIRKYGLPPESFDRIDAMTVVGLSTDFFCKGGKLEKPELEFNIESKNPKYLVNGKMDKPVIYNDKFVRIVDYKSSKKQYEGDELKMNVQALMYSMAAKKLWPHLIPIVDFIFLQFPEDPVQRLRFKNSDLAGFEHFLADIAKQMANFSYKEALLKMAAKQKMPGPGEGFRGKLLCGWAGPKKGFVSSPDQKKANGEPSYYCPQRFPYEYWALCGEDGGVIRTSKQNDLVADESKGQFVVKKHYTGCAAFQK